MKPNRPSWPVLGAALGLLAAAAFGAQQWEVTPLNGLIYHTTERSALTYDCDLPVKGELRCKFNQTAVRKKSGPAEVQKKLAELEEELRSLEVGAQSCKDAQELIKEAKKNAKQVEKADPRDREQIAAYLSGLERACTTGDKGPLRATLRKAVERELKSCTVSSYYFEQSFKMVPGLSAERTTWVTTGEPTGECGVVQLSRFERDDTEKGFTVWNYIARKAVTNPRGEMPLLGRCSELDEETYKYSWRSNEAFSSWADCDEIEFTVL